MDILRWGAGAEVIEPPGLRMEIMAAAEQMIKKYEQKRATVMI